MALDSKQVKKDNVTPEKVTPEKKPVLPKSKENQVLKKRLVLLSVKIGFFVLVCFLVFGVIFGFTRMSDESMYPNIKNGDLLIYYRLESKYSNGDAVIVDRGNGNEVYRIVALPGQTVDIENGKLLVDGQPSTVEVFLETEKDEKTALSYPYTVPDGSYFVMNDFRKDTNDSRKFGQIPRNEIKGRLITKIQIRDL